MSSLHSGVTDGLYDLSGSVMDIKSVGHVVTTNVIDTRVYRKGYDDIREDVIYTSEKDSLYRLTRGCHRYWSIGLIVWSLARMLSIPEYGQFVSTHAKPPRG